MKIGSILQISQSNSLLRNNKTNITTLTERKENNNRIYSYPANYYMTSPIAFEAKNTELIEQMQKAIKNNPKADIKKLFEQMTEQAQNNVKGLVEKFKDNLTLEQYLTACANEPQLFYQLPETLANNVTGLVEKFKDKISLDKYLDACLNQPQLFSQLPFLSY